MKLRNQVWEMVVCILAAVAVMCALLWAIEPHSRVMKGFIP